MIVLEDEPKLFTHQIKWYTLGLNSSSKTSLQRPPMTTLPPYLQARSNDRRIHRQSNSSQHLIITSDDDTGVMLNGGRLGARLGAKAIINSFHQLIAASDALSHHVIPLCPELTRHPQLFETDFKAYQAQQIDGLKKILNQSWTKLVHLGGGHDHIYPLLCAIESEVKKPLCIINLDAHLDTRVDEQHHSGTPFRQFSNASQFPMKLLQVGIHEFSNPLSNHQPLSKGQMLIVSPDNVMKSLEKELSDEYQVVLSLDADALDASVMEAVSAVNPQGLKLELVHQVIDLLQSREERAVFGIYEYNPVYDNLSQKGARVLARMMDHFLS